MPSNPSNHTQFKRAPSPEREGQVFSKIKAIQSGRAVTLALVLAVATMALFIAADRGSPDPAEAATGGINVQQWCSRHYGGSTAAISAGWNAYGWRCVYGFTRYSPAFSVNMNQACQEQRAPWAYARIGNFFDPYSWYCVW